jgi:hypothetical protein
MEFSNFIISACLASISASVCFACCVSIIICKHNVRVRVVYTLYPKNNDYKQNWPHT